LEERGSLEEETWWKEGTMDGADGGVYRETGWGLG
jgi:hypothetical protein